MSVPLYQDSSCLRRERAREGTVDSTVDRKVALAATSAAGAGGGLFLQRQTWTSGLPGHSVGGGMTWRSQKPEGAHVSPDENPNDTGAFAYKSRRNVFARS